VRRRAAQGLALLLAALAACGGEEEPAAPSRLVVITLDTTRADALGAYGQPLPVTPRIDAMAAEGTLFEQVSASVPSTLPSHATLFTGREPFAHGVRSNFGYRLPDSAETLAEILRARGFATRAEVAAPVLASGQGLAQGFEAYGEPSRVAALEAMQRHGISRTERGAEEISEAALAFLREHADRPFLLWLHYFDPHEPYEAPEPFASEIADPYLAEVRRADHAVGRVLDEIERLGLRRSTLVVLTADHGEARGEHGEESHAFFVYESTLRVPLVLWGAGAPRGVRVTSLVRLVDVLPTLLDLLGAPAPAGVAGTSLRALLAEPERDLGLVAYGESVEPAALFGSDVLRSLREGRFKYVHKLRPELFDLATDPAEKENLAGERPEVVERLRAQLLELVAAVGPAEAARSELDPEQLAQLRALGYVGGSAGPEIGDEGAALALHGPDPRDLVLDFRIFSFAWGSLLHGEPALAEPRFRELVARHPRSELALEGLLASLQALGRDAEQIPVLRAGIAALPALGSLRVRLAARLRAQGEGDEAESVLREALALDRCDESARLLLADLLRERRRHAEQVALLDGAEGCPASPILDNALAFALATLPDPRLRDGARALALAESVVAAGGAANPDHLDTLAAAYAELGRFDEARAEQQRALALVEGREVPKAFVASLREHLARIEAGQAIREPVR
jgi:arylsulfatase A-like enzyme/Flp pilus assembly protein TadD